MTSEPTTDRTPSTPSPVPPAAAPATTNRSGSGPLWVLLVLGVLTNVAASAFFTHPWVSSAGGVLVLVSLAGFALRARTARTARQGRG